MNSDPPESFTEQFRILIARYLDGHEPLDTVATRFAEVWAAWSGSLALKTPPPLASKGHVGGFLVGHVADDLRPDATPEEARRMEELFAAAFAKLPGLRDGAV